MLQIQKGLTSPSVLLRDRFCTIISDFKGNLLHVLLHLSLLCWGKILPYMWTQPLCHSQWWQSVTEQHSFKVHSQWVHTVHILCISTRKKVLVRQASEKEPSVKGWCRVPYTVHPDSDQFIKFGGHTGAFWHPSALSCKKVFVGIYLFILAGFRFAFFLLLVM